MEQDISNFIITPPKNYSTVNLINEQKWAVYCIDNPISSFDVSLDKVLNYDCRKILETVQYLYNSNLSVTPDEISSIFQVKNINIPHLAIKSLMGEYKDFSNIEFIKQQINDNFISYTYIPKIMKDVYETLNTGNCLDKGKIKDLSNELNKTLFENEKTHILEDTEKLRKDYIQILNDRKLNMVQHSLGFRTLDKHITRPAAAGEITAIVGLKGSGKSIFVKSMEYGLINLQTCVLSLNLEMTKESNLDRAMSILGDIPITDLQLKNIPEKTSSILYSTLNKFAMNKYYLYSDESTMSLNDLNIYITKAKQEFKKKGVLQSEYMVVTIDLLEQITNFSQAKNVGEIKNAMNILHSIAKSQKVHIVIVLQANENKIRGTTFKKIDDLQYYKIGLEDIYGSSAYGERSRVVISLSRPKHLQLLFFPEKTEEIALMTDIINLNCIKQNDGKLFFERFTFAENFQIYPYRDDVVVSPSI